MTEQTSPFEREQQASFIDRLRNLSAAWRRTLLIACVLLLIYLVAVFAPFLAPHDPYEVSVINRLEPPLFQDDGRIYLLGTDGVGRDVLSRIIHGSRLSLLISTSAVGIAAVLGTVLGLIAGYVRGKTDAVIMRLIDIWLAFPAILLALSVAAMLGASVINLIVAISLSRWTSYARIVRGNVLSVREHEYVSAAEAIGVPRIRILFRHILPNILDVIVILAALHLGQMIILEAALSFLGLGIQPPTPSWGGMIGDGRDYLHNAWWVATFPGVAIAVTVLTAGLMGDALRDALDPRYRVE